MMLLWSTITIILCEKIFKFRIHNNTYLYKMNYLCLSVQIDSNGGKNIDKYV